MFHQLTKETFYNQKDKSILQKVLNTLPGLSAVKDLENQYLICNDTMANLMGIDSGEEFVAKQIQDDQVSCKVASSASHFKHQDKQVLEMNKPVTIITNECYAGEKWLLSLGKKFTLTDENNVAYGVGFHVQDVTNSPLINLSQFLSFQNTPYGHHKRPQFTYIVAENHEQYDLSQRQMECLFFYLRGKSVNEIAFILKISKRTVETYMDSIKVKFNCQHKAELIEKALDAGMLNYIPQRLLVGL